MTFRAKPVVKRAHRPAWEGQDRRNFYLNLGFGLVVLLAVGILVIAAGVSWYNEHLAPVGSVDGDNITKDDFNDRLAIETWRLDQAEQRIRTATVAGHLTATEASAQQSQIDAQRQQIDTITLERLIDTKLQGKLATQEGVTVSPADIDARLVVEATSPALRHAWVIEVKPVSDVGAISPTDAQKAAAQAKADAALKDIQGGKSWEDVAKTVSTDAATAPQSGDLGWLLADDTQVDEPFLTAVFAADVNTPTAVVEGADGTYRIGRVTEISPVSVDTTYQATIQNDHIDLGKYRTVVQGDVVHQKLEDKLVADATGPAPQRHVSEIEIKPADPATTADSVKVRHILYSPKDDPQGAADLAADDPAWAQAQAEATVTYEKLKANPALFDSIARTDSDELSARGATGTGGKLPYYGPGSNVDAAFLAAITAPGLVPGQLLPPVRSAFGWHVIQVMYGPTDADHMTALKTQADGGSDFATLARDNSEATSAGIGGDLGWVAKGELPDTLMAAIFAAPIGKTSDVVTVADTPDAGANGTYLFKVLAEETRTPEGRQLEQLRNTAFSTWYDAKKSAANITRDETIANGASAG
jgi:parvulin-like peptidyl-prolyl isomerase